MLRLESEIKIGGLFFDFGHEVKIKSSWKQLTDTCSIKEPRNLKTRDGIALDKTVKYGDVVSVKFGYHEYGMPERFKGYLDLINAETVIAEISCQDEMWKLKQSNITKSWKNANLEDVIKHIKQATHSSWEYEILGDTVHIGQVKFETLNASRCFLKLKDDYGIHCFFRQGKLIVGKPYEPDPTRRVKRVFEYGRNVISWKGLVYKRKGEANLKVKIINHKANGTKKEFTVGDINGEERTLDFYERKDEDLHKEAQSWLDKMKYDGYRGKILAFGEPLVRHGDVAVIKDWRYPERDGEYWIDTVETTMKVASIRQEIELGPKAN